MTGLTSKEFLDNLRKVRGVKRHANDTLSYRGRSLYVLLDNSTQQSVDPSVPSPFYYWRTYQSYKKLQSNWVSMSGERILELAVLLDPKDKIKGEYRDDLGTARDNLGHIHYQENYDAKLKKSDGFIIKAKLEEPKDIEELLSQIK